MAVTGAIVLDLDPSRDGAGGVIEDIVRLEKMIFPKHESLARSFRDELKRRNSGLIYSTACAGGVDGGQEVAGFAMYVRDTSLCASIIKLAVKESCRRQGHGEALLKAAVERCRRRRVQRVILHVDPARTAAIALYRKLGFQVDARCHRRELLLPNKECVPDVRGSPGIMKSRAKINLFLRSERRNFTVKCTISV